MIDVFIKLFVTFFYVGYSPYMPGTVASFVTMGIWFLMPKFLFAYSMMLLFLLSLCAVWASGKFARLIHMQDPSSIVIDEVVGMSIALIGLPQKFLLYVTVFILFRFFDIYKIFPVNIAEKNLPHGWGIVGDDVVAGCMARGLTVLFISCLTF